jgi:hypothetical protein
MYPWILSFETINKLKRFLNAVFLGLKMWDTFASAAAIFLTHFVISIVVLVNVPPNVGLAFSPFKRVLALCPEEIDVVLELQLEDKVLLNQVVGRRFVDAVAEEGEAG